MKNIFDSVEKSLEAMYAKADKAKKALGKRFPKLLTGFSEEKYPRLAKLKEDLNCVIYFTVFRLILTIIVLPAILVILPAVGLYNFVKSKVKALKSKKEATA